MKPEVVMTGTIGVVTLTCDPTVMRHNKFELLVVREEGIEK